MKFASLIFCGLLLVVLAGCSSGGGDSARILQLTEELEAAEAAADKATKDAADKDAADKATKDAADKAAANKATKDAADKAAANKATKDAADKATKDAADALAAAQRAGEDNTRGYGLREELETLATATIWQTAGSQLPTLDATTTMSAPLKARSFTGGTSTAGKFRKATLTDTMAGGGDTEKIVAYTDRELRRTFTEHFGISIQDYQAEDLLFNVQIMAAAADAASAGWSSSNLLESTYVKPLIHGFRTTKLSTGAVAQTELRTMPISARVLGVPGNFVCEADCDISVEAAYNPEGTEPTTSNKLTGITLAPTDSGALYFQPTNANSTIPLDGSLKVGVAGATTALVDTEYLLFGWWQRIPYQADEDYEVAVFTDTHTPSLQMVNDPGYQGMARYQGPAVGVYAEQRSAQSPALGGVRQAIVESGDFTATANLQATFNGDVGSSIQGDVAGFITTDHGSKDWRVNLESITTGATGVAKIAQSVGTRTDPVTSTGRWEYEFLERYADSTHNLGDSQPIAAVGRFDARIENVRHITGAFGVHRTTGTIIPAP